MNRKIIRILGVIIAVLLLYWLIVDITLQYQNKQQHNLLEKSRQFKQIRILTSKLDSKPYRKHQSLLSDINALQQRYELNEALGKVNIIKNEALIKVQSADYAMLIKFLLQAKTQGIAATGLKLRKVDEGLVSGELKLKR